jgi:lysophospholipase L1-like esterase
MLATRRPALLAAFLLSALAAAARADDPKVTLKKGDRIVFLGDSITAGGVGPKGYITVMKSALADKGVELIGAGVSGNKVPDLQRRVEKDVIARKPTLVYIYIGINDVWHGERDPARGTSKEKFEGGLKEVIGKVQAAGATVILCTPTVIGEKKADANLLDARLDEYADVSRKVAREMKVPLCDLRKAFVEHLKTNNPDDKERGVLTGDRVHLNDAGNKLVAETMLRMLD